MPNSKIPVIAAPKIFLNLAKNEIDRSSPYLIRGIETKLVSKPPNSKEKLSLAYYDEIFTEFCFYP
jgi:hypothetical protein